MDGNDPAGLSHCTQLDSKQVLAYEGEAGIGIEPVWNRRGSVSSAVKNVCPLGLLSRIGRRPKPKGQGIGWIECDRSRKVFDGRLDFAPAEPRITAAAKCFSVVRVERDSVIVVVNAAGAVANLPIAVVAPLVVRTHTWRSSWVRHRGKYEKRKGREKDCSIHDHRLTPRRAKAFSCEHYSIRMEATLTG